MKKIKNTFKRSIKIRTLKIHKFNDGGNKLELKARMRRKFVPISTIESITTIKTIDRTHTKGFSNIH
jgi:hypothetical protein